jgi:ubiquinone/menaquinone biosynthesis C-methylase UbiE
MNSFEKEYYEADRFWKEGVLEDPNNLERITITVDMIPGDVTSLADIGCGNGLFLNTLQQNLPGMELEGIDRSEEALKYVKTKKHIADIVDLGLPDSSFDCASCLQVLEHLPVNVYEQSLPELARISRKYLLVSVPFDEDLEEKMTTCPSCQSRFNANLHLRRYSEADFRAMFAQHGFGCTQIKFTGKTSFYKFHKEYRKLFYPNGNKKWNSPICPICGFKEKEQSSIVERVDIPEKAQPQKTSLLSMVKSIPKLIWPRELKYYWIIGLFERKQTGPKNEK